MLCRVLARGLRRLEGLLVAGTGSKILRPIGVARTPYRTREACPRQPDPDGPECRIEIEPAYREGLAGVAEHDAVDVLLWLDDTDRDTLVAHPRGDRSRPRRGVFALRAPDRPNPIAISRVPVVTVTGDALVVRGLDAVDGTAVVDVKSAV